MSSRTTPRVVAQLSFDELQQLRWLLGGCLILLSASTAFYLGVEATVQLGFVLAAVAIGFARPAVLARVPRWVHRLAFPVVVAVFTVDLWWSGELLAATVRLDLLLLFYRAIAYRQRREDLQVVVLGLFLVVLAGVLTVSLTFAAQILAFTAVALALLLTLTLVQSMPGAEAAAVMPGEAPSWARHVGWVRLLARVRQATRWRVVALGIALFGGLVALSALLFVAIPRFQLEGGLFLDRFFTRQTRTGFSDTVRFGEVTEITQDNSVALRVDVSDRAQVPAAPYWRMLVLDEYRDGVFRLSPQLRGGFKNQPNALSLRGTRRRSAIEGAQWTFYLEPGVSRYLPLLGPFETLRYREPQGYTFAGSLGIVALRTEPATMLAYRVEGMDVGARLADPEFARRLRQWRGTPRAALALLLRLDLGDDDRRVLRGILDELGAGEVTDAAEFGRRTARWLAQHHVYSLRPRIPAGGGDPLVRWTRSEEGGHCELFAGALVVLARSAGIPARVVTGFRGGSWNAYSNNFTLRNSDAHAWCELFDEGSGEWLRVDPTPGSTAAGAEEGRGEAALARRFDRSWTARLDSLRVFWYRRIVSFDERAQTDALRAVKDATLDSGHRLSEFFSAVRERLRGWISEPWQLTRVLRWFAAVVAAGVIAIWLRRVNWSFVLLTVRGRAARMDAVRREATRWLARLGRADARSSGEADQVRQQLLRVRFGPPVTLAEALPVFRRARRALRGARRKVG